MSTIDLHYPYHYVCTCQNCHVTFIANRNDKMPLGLHPTHKCSKCRSRSLEYMEIKGPIIQSETVVPCNSSIQHFDEKYYPAIMLLYPRENGRLRWSCIGRYCRSYDDCDNPSKRLIA